MEEAETNTEKRAGCWPSLAFASNCDGWPSTQLNIKTSQTWTVISVPLLAIFPSVLGSDNIGPDMEAQGMLSYGLSVSLIMAENAKLGAGEIAQS